VFNFIADIVEVEVEVEVEVDVIMERIMGSLHLPSFSSGRSSVCPTDIGMMRFKHVIRNLTQVTGVVGSG